jgi:1-acyl-sn-glycerol-3-phosphate acyltransferase
MSRPGLLRNGLGYLALARLLLWFIVASRFNSPAELTPRVIDLTRRFFKALGIEAVLVGGERLSADRPTLYMSSHQGLFDHFLALSLLPGRTIGLEKAETQRYPVYGRAARYWGQIFIRRDDPAAAKQACATVVERLRAGTSVVVYPEGTRSKDGRLGPLKKGVFHIAAGAGVPIVPVAVVGMFELMPPGRALCRQGRVELRVGEAIPPCPDTPEGREALRERVRERLEALRSAPTAATAPAAPPLEAP